jgi:hypothetical protein
VPLPVLAQSLVLAQLPLPVQAQSPVLAESLVLAQLSLPVLAAVAGVGSVAAAGAG